MKLNSIKRVSTIYMFCTLVIILVYSTISFLTEIEQPSSVMMSWIAVITSVVAIIYMVFATDHIYGHSMAFLIYLIFTQFGTCFVVYAIPLVELPSRGYYNTDWIRVDSYPRAVQLGIIAVITFTLFVVWKGNALAKKNKRTKTHKKFNQNINYRPIAWVGLIIVSIILFLLIYLVMSGSFSLEASYSKFLEYSQSNVGIWSMAMSLLPTGFAFVVTMGNRSDMKVLYVLYGLVSIILLLTGNKGEVLYAVLAGFGIYCYKKNMISKKVLIGGVLILLILIPTVSSFRSDSVYDMLGNYVVSVSDPLIEMGYQIRLSVFMIDGVDSGMRDYLLGFSYINPLVNIINRLFPFIPRLEDPISFDFQTTYDTMGFSQVAESYANFGWFGVYIFFLIMGWIFARFDNEDRMSPKGALYAGWLIIFINMTRNVFAFVLGQLLMVYVIWKIAMITCNSIKNYNGDGENDKSITYIWENGSCRR